jgi:Radical SAM superfamily
VTTIGSIGDLACPAGFASECLKDPGSQPLKTPHRHRNITVKRLFLDACQFVRTQSFVSERFGRPFQPSRKYAEIDVTYKCNLKCLNCNRSCTQAPSDREMPVADIEDFLRQSIEKKIEWKRIRILGGEPTLHSRIYDIIDCLISYQREVNPSVRLVLGTHFSGNRVHRVLERLPDTIVIKSTLKSSRVNLFRPFNRAPADTVYNRFSDYTCGCRIIDECGLGVTPSGYYMCAVAGGIDRIFNYDLGRKEIPDEADTLVDQMSVICRLCGHFGFQWPTRRARLSKTWRLAYRRYRKKSAIGLTRLNNHPMIQDNLDLDETI